ncbi:hypothetical protein RSOL_299420, partial [Rhizoctonia solani AG-3 Rhs1AP]
MSMRRYIPENSRRGKQSQLPLPPPPPPPREDKTNADGSKEQGAEVGKRNSESESESEHAGEDSETNQSTRTSQGFKRTGAAFTSDEIAAMSHEVLVRNLEATQRDERIEETRDHTSTDQPSETPTTAAPANPSNQNHRSMELAHARRSLKSLADLKDGNVVGPTVRDANGVAQYWTTNNQGVKRLTPAWEEDFEINMKFWGEDFLRRCRVEQEMPALGRDYLKTVTDEAFLKALKEGAWRSYAANAKLAARGALEQSREAKNQNNRANGRRGTKATQHAKASQGTCVDSGLPDFSFLYRPRAQSLPVANKDNSGQEVVLVPSYLSDAALVIKEALDSKTGSRSKKSLVYIKFDEPLPKLDEYKKSMHLIDPLCTIVPNVTEFTQLYSLPREYLPSIPSGVKLPGGDNRPSTSTALAHNEHLATPSNRVEDSPAIVNFPGTNEGFQVDEDLELPLPPPAVPQLAKVANATDVNTGNTAGHADIPNTTDAVDVQNPGPYEHQLNEGHYVNGEFIAAPPTSGGSDAHVSTQLFGVLIDPKGQHVATSPSISPQKRVIEGNEAMSKRRKKEVSGHPPQRSTRLQSTQVDENTNRDDEQAIGGGSVEKVILRISRK